jgi:hypothetical protein
MDLKWTDLIWIPFWIGIFVFIVLAPYTICDVIARFLAFLCFWSSFEMILVEGFDKWFNPD